MTDSVAKPGFQGSETSRVEITAYTFGDELGVSTTVNEGPTIVESASEAASSDTLVFHSTKSQQAGVPIVVRAMTTKQMGAPAGTFAFDIKADRTGMDYVMTLSDDDWVDIVMTRHGIKTHVMRGQIEDIRRETIVSSKGATLDVMRVSGRDFGRIFDITPIWFDILSDGALGAGATARVLEANKSFFADPATTVESILAGFLRELANIGRSHWELPASLVNIQRTVGSSAAFINNICFFDRDFINHPVRSAPLGPSLYTVKNQMVWQYALGWADLPVCEIYTELLDAPAGAAFRASTGPRPAFGVISNLIDYPAPNDDLANPVELTPASSIMGVVFRDRPFPSTTFKDRSNIELDIEKSAWFKRLPMVTVPPQHVIVRSVGRSGAERRNAFFVKPRLYHELAGAYFDFNAPLFDSDDMKRHGMRRLDTTFIYTRGVDADENLALSFTYRKRVRDFHCMNHLFYNGTIALGYGRPDIRIGTKFRISSGDVDTQETYYVESVHNEWSLSSGLRTTLGVSRGWIGSDASLVGYLKAIINKYLRRTETAEIEHDFA